MGKALNLIRMYVIWMTIMNLTGMKGLIVRMSYRGDSMLNDTKESLDSEFHDSELSVGIKSDNKEDFLDPSDDDRPLEEVRRPYEEGYKAFLMLGMTFANKGELKRAMDNYVIKIGVQVKVTRSKLTKL